MMTKEKTYRNDRELGENIISPKSLFHASISLSYNA
jgi:hypothetical protein